MEEMEYRFFLCCRFGASRHIRSFERYSCLPDVLWNATERFIQRAFSALLNAALLEISR